jgi:hypothetical protein
MSPVNPPPPLPSTLLGSGSGDGNGDSKVRREAQVGGNLWPSSPTHAAAGGSFEGEVRVRGRNRKVSCWRRRRQWREVIALVIMVRVECEAGEDGHEPHDSDEEWIISQERVHGQIRRTHPK